MMGILALILYVFVVFPAIILGILRYFDKQEKTKEQSYDKDMD